MEEVVGLKSPVAIFFYNRPDTLRRVVNQFSGINPKSIYVISDGFNAKKPNDERLVLECRSIAEEAFETKNFKKIYRSENFGLFQNITLGIEEVFENEEECIFLEDDTVPSATFFKFCDELLERYRNSPEIGTISGFKLFADWKSKNANSESYFFSKYPQVWGWATWKSKWNLNYDKNISDWPQWEDSKNFYKLFSSNREAKFWHRKLAGVYENKYTWDYQLAFSHFHKSLLTAVPMKNLVTNIGLGRPDSTNTIEPNSMAIRPLLELETLQHPKSITQNREYDGLMSKWYAPSIRVRLRKKFKRMLGKYLYMRF